MLRDSDRGPTGLKISGGWRGDGFQDAGGLSGLAQNNTLREGQDVRYRFILTKFPCFLKFWPGLYNYL